VAGLEALAGLWWGAGAGYVGGAGGVFSPVASLPLPGATAAAMLAAPDGGRRVLTFIIIAICSDIGGYAAGITLGRTGAHKLAPVISPKKTWEGLAGSALACIAAGAILLPSLLHGHWWQGVILGAAAVTAAVFGDLAASMIKRDLGIKDFGRLLPGHGGVLDRIDSLLTFAPVAWLLLAAFVK